MRRRPEARLCPLAAAALGLLLPLAAAAQPSAGQTAESGSTLASPETSPVEYSSPYDAFDAGAYSQALDGFVDRQTVQPDDPELSLNAGAAHYKLNDFESADAQFFRAATTGDDGLRAEALYNLGNSAYRQGRLGEAIDFYMASLEVNPDDLDTKFNLEFVREELKNRQQQQQSQDGQDQERNESQDREDRGAQQQPEGEGEQTSDQQPEQADQGSDEQPRGGESPRDSDDDGLDDGLERNADNPTDPLNPDSDADGLPDGQEDRNRNGRVDPGETDPNRRDSDGDGVPDAADPDSRADGPESGNRGGPEEQPAGMTPEEAERFLQALEEGRPDPTRRAQRGRRSRQAKDW